MKTTQLLACLLAVVLPGRLLVAETNVPTARLGETGIKLYSDYDAEIFRARLDKLTYPTTLAAACEKLGIDLRRLGISILNGLGATAVQTTVLSKNYDLVLKCQMVDEHGKRLQNWKITKIEIVQSRGATSPMHPSAHPKVTP